MGGFLLIAFIILVILGFAFFGFIRFLMFLFGATKPSEPPIPPRSNEPSENNRTIAEDAFGASYLLNHFFKNKRIDRSTYDRLRRFLEAELGDEHKLAEPIAPAKIVPPKPASSPVARSTERESKPSTSSPIKSKERSIQPTTAQDDAVEAEIISTGQPPAPEVVVTFDESASQPTGQSAPQSIAPWDHPDPPPRAPRRSFNEMMASFMLEKNIRWGELVSGILIIGSAVGLVVSLRNELRDTIPYFSALLFMLITAAIHAAGIYTLKKWKLQNTSRGTLLIGLMLVPLNFVAACILSGSEDKRELSDPLLWTAIIVGLASFGTMTWFSSKCLLRRGQLPLVIAIMGSAIGTLLINRLSPNVNTSVGVMLLSLPLVASFLVGTTMFYKLQWVRKRWPDRTSRRMYVFLGISAFAFLCAASLAVIRGEDKPATLVALLPAFAVVGLMTSWLGRIVWNGAGGQQFKTLSLTGMSLHILGLVLIGGSLICSMSIPVALLVNAACCTVGLLLFARHQAEARILPPAWISFALFVLCLVNLLMGKLSWDGWTSIQEFGNAILGGQSGLALLAAGIFVIGVHETLGQKNAASRFLPIGVLSGVGIFGIGCVIALLASFINPANQFDMMTATGLLGVASLAGIVACALPKVITHPKLSSVVPHVTAIVTFGFLAHAFAWNPKFTKWLNSIAFDIHANWVLIFAIHAVLLVLACIWLRKQPASEPQAAVELENPNEAATFASNEVANEYGPLPSEPKRMGPHVMAEDLGEYVAFSCIATLIAAVFFVSQQTGLATGVAVIMTLVALLLVWIQVNHSSGTKYWVSLFTSVSAVAVVYFVTELLTRTEWCDLNMGPRIFLVSSIALSLWGIIALLLNWRLGLSPHLKRFVEFHPRLEWLVAYGLVFVVGLIIVGSLIGDTGQELNRNYSSGFADLANHRPWVFAAIALVGIALSMTAFVRPMEATGVALMSSWLLAWGMSANFFVDSVSVGSAIRWLLPLGGLVGAIVVASRRPLLPVWVAARNKAGLSGRSMWSSKVTQRLINLALAVVAVVVLLITTIAIARVLMTGGVAALGGPETESWFGRMKKDVSYGIPVGIMVGTFLLYAISEKRKWLATSGSAVFQYCVIVAVILLFASPHPNLASSWFVNILQAVSIGMTGYGIAWWWYRDRVEGTEQLVSSTNSTEESAEDKVSQLEIHTLINGFLVSALAALVMIRVYAFPSISADWINTVGSALGIAAWACFGGLAYMVWRVQLNQPHRTSTWLWLTTWLGLVLVGMVGAIVDRLHTGTSFVAWQTFDVMTWGIVIVCAIQVVLLWLESRPELLSGIYRERSSKRFTSLRSDQTAPLLFAGSILIAFCIRGIVSGPGTGVAYFVALLIFIVCLVIAGLLRQSGWIAFISAGVTTLTTLMLVGHDPFGWFTERQPYLVNVLSVSLSVLAMVWSGVYVYRTLSQADSNSDSGHQTTTTIRPAMVWMSNVVLLLTCGWIVLGAIAQWMMEAGAAAANVSSLKNAWGVGAIFGPLALGILHLWNDQRKGLVGSLALWLLGVVIFAVAIAVPVDGLRGSAIALGLGGVVTCFGLVWVNRRQWIELLKGTGAPKLVRLERSMDCHLHWIALAIGLVILIWGFGSSILNDVRVERYLVALSPFALAVGIGCLSDQNKRRWLQIVALGVTTLGAIFLAWADLTPSRVSGQPMRYFVRCQLVLAGAMFVYGGLVSRWVSEGGAWLKSLREMAIATCMLALPCFLAIVLQEFLAFRPDEGCGMPASEAYAVAVVVLGMIIGLIIIAVRPENDPFAFSLQGRMGYVYAAQVVAALLVMHLYLSMPYLFRIGIKDYWPYIAMLVCFGGVGLAHVLEKRNLTVLGQPLFNTAVVLPVLVGGCIWAVDSKADPSLVMLTIGMIYLLISYTHRSLLSGAAAIAFGNAALWLFYDKFDSFKFVEHPQLWLIPPAISTLVAAQLCRSRFSKPQLATIRYVCAAIIYVSSTSEIFISGLGTQLWPPVILALLAIGGIFAGMMLQIRAFLYFGAMFLLLAMITMVSHAHQRLDHVWPWWAFGIGMGIAILVMFGLFEKRKNDMKAVLGRLSEWDL